MPEGPEVKTTVDFLKTYTGKTISNLSVLSGRYTKKRGIENLANVNLPAKIESVDCKGKFIYFTLSYVNSNKKCYLFNTLGMTGMWSDKMTKHARFAILLGDDSILYYNDTRNFGTLKFVLSKSILDKKLKSLGPDVLNCDIDWQEFKNMFIKKPNKTIAECLMNQSVICGVGNYLKSEILYASKISPHRIVKDITNDEWRFLHFYSIAIPKRSYILGGATIKDYRSPDGKKGNFSRRFAVYNCKLDPVNNIIIKETTKDKRSTYWVPEIQK